MEAFKQQLIHYLGLQKQYEEEDIERIRHLSPEQKEAEGILLRGAVVERRVGKAYDLFTPDNASKIRVGDAVTVYAHDKSARGKVIDITHDHVSIETAFPLKLEETVDLESKEFMLLDAMIALLEQVAPGRPGAYFLRELSGEEPPMPEGLGMIDPERVRTIPDTLNRRQREAVTDILKKPTVYCVQGPPGTGKTAVLATLAHTYATQRLEVLVLANTHQAVNNALQKIRQKSPLLKIFKIGEALKGEGLDPSITLHESYSAYLAERKLRKSRELGADIIGMTLHSAVVNLGLRHSPFQPQLVMVDEAGQMPMVYASTIGTFGSGTLVFIGDDAQMPPIYHPKLVGDPFSRSIFEYLCGRYPDLRHTLQVTYRMNGAITDFIDRTFYRTRPEEPCVIASDYSRDRTLPLSEEVKTEDARIRDILTDEKSLFLLDVSGDALNEDMNEAEAEFAFALCEAARHAGLPKAEMAVVTPYRRQVRTVRSRFKQELTDDELPLIDTVECLQGQDVELIVISFAATSPAYIAVQQQFLMDPHRINVMVSRAKTKVVLLMGEALQKIFRERYPQF